MTALAILAVLLALALLLPLLRRRTGVEADAAGRTEAAAHSPGSDCSQCGQAADRCAVRCLLSGKSEEPEYYEDEHLDRYRGRAPETYTPEEREEFDYVRRTMRPEEVRGWRHSLALRGIRPPFILLMLLAASACSTQKNTSASRWWHGFKARYNTYYNGAVAYVDGSLEKERGHRDNFTELIPLYPVSAKQSRETGKGNYDRAIEKAEKAIHQHSIRRRPAWDKRRRKTAKDIEWLGRKEYNPFLWRAWMLMGRAQFHKGDFDAAASTFAYMSRLYATQPAILGKARAWLAKAYTEEGWQYNAENVIRDMQRDSIHWRAQKEWDYTYADYYLHTEQYREAIPWLRRVIRHEMRSRQKAREWYLLGQLYALIGEQDSAYRAFRHVARHNPPYELEFNARIAQTEVLARSRGHRMVGRLRRMAASDNNKDYLDQVYYAIGNIHLAARDTLAAVSAYEEGAKRSTRGGIEKGVLLLRLGDLYWERMSFAAAQRCYGEAVGLIERDHREYARLARRSETLDALVPWTEAIHLQDSLQSLAAMGEAERNAAIDRVIDALKRKEREERRLQQEQDALQMQQQGGTGADRQRRGNQPRTPQPQQQGGGQWYFYNPMAVEQGKATFRKLWGRRDNVDHWQRNNQTVLAAPTGAEEVTDEEREQMAREAARADSLRQTADSAAQDPHRREYYMASLPFTAGQRAESDSVIAGALHQAGVICQERLDNTALAVRYLLRLESQYPDYPLMDDVYYHLALLHMRQHREAEASRYTVLLRERYPRSKYTTILTDPDYAENARHGEHLEDSLYTAAYRAFLAGDAETVERTVAEGERRFPLGANRDKRLFIGALTRLERGDAAGCIRGMETVVDEFPGSRISEMAGMIVRGVRAGRSISGGHFDMGSVWSRRTVVMDEADSTAALGFTAEEADDFLYVIAYPADSLNEHRLLYEVARHNFSHFLSRDFDIAITGDEGLHRLEVSGFRNHGEALTYAAEIQPLIQPLLATTPDHRRLLISRRNLELIGQRLSYDDYETFYREHFAPRPAPLSAPSVLIEPNEVVARPGQEDAPPPPPAGEAVTDRQGTLIPIEPPVKTEKGEKTGTVVSEQQPAKNKTGIYFRQATDKAAEKKKTADGKKPKKKTFDPEDEYYELEGF